MSYDDDEYGHPTEIGEFARPEALNGHLLIVYPVGYRDDVQTKYGVKDAVVVDIVDLDDKDDRGQPGKLYRMSNFMQGKLIQTLRPFIGRKVLGRMGIGVNKGGLNPPWVITDLSADPVALERAKAWRVANPGFIPSQFIPPEEWERRQAMATQQLPDPWAQSRPPMQPASQPAPQRPSEPPPLRTVTGEPVLPPQPQLPPVAHAVDGSTQLSTDELNMLQQLRMEKARKEAAEKASQDQFTETAPF